MPHVRDPRGPHQSPKITKNTPLRDEFPLTPLGEMAIPWNGPTLLISDLIIKKVVNEILFSAGFVFTANHLPYSLKIFL